MLEFFKNLLNKEPIRQENDKKSRSRTEIVTCALFIELAYADDEFNDEEREFIINLMKKEFDLNEEEVHELLEYAGEKMEKNISLYEYTDIINTNFDKTEKYLILKNLWKLILIDGKLDSHEEYFIRKISNNLNMEHRDLISAKAEVKKEFNRD
ncbi:MAG: TerB family tellurite resistance protein [Melioribacteraceae bacterium]|nr:TerB family tellurite resistance protein [Melioribacteraceae bacterium]